MVVRVGPRRYCSWCGVDQLIACEEVVFARIGSKPEYVLGCRLNGSGGLWVAGRWVAFGWCGGGLSDIICNSLEYKPIPGRGDVISFCGAGCIKVRSRPCIEESVKWHQICARCCVGIPRNSFEIESGGPCGDDVILFRSIDGVEMASGNFVVKPINGT